MRQEKVFQSLSTFLKEVTRERKKGTLRVREEHEQEHGDGRMAGEEILGSDRILMIDKGSEHNLTWILSLCDLFERSGPGRRGRNSGPRWSR